MMLSRMRSKSKVTSSTSTTPVEDGSTLLSSKIDSDVAKATVKFETMKKKFRPLLLALKAQHAAMVDLNKRRLETVQQYEWFVSGTPLEHLAVGKNASFALVEDRNQEEDNNDDGGATYLQLEFPNNDEIVKESAGKGVESEDDDRNDESKVDCNAVEEEKEETDFDNSATSAQEVNSEEDKSSLENASEEVEEPSKPKPEAVASTPRPEASIKTTTIATPSFTSLHCSVRDFNKVQEERFAELITYTEKWIETVSSRIESNLVQFEDLKNNLECLSQKVKSPPKGKSSGRRSSVKLAQNKTKLRGAQEVHDSFGESLFLQLDEVTTRAWKDFYPLLVMAFDFDANYSSLEAQIFSDLEEMVPRLLEIGAEYNLDVGGRLEDLEKCHPWEFYTGDKDIKVVSRVTRAPTTK